MQSAGLQRGYNTPPGPQTTTAAPWRLCRLFLPSSLGSYPVDQIQSHQPDNLPIFFSLTDNNNLHLPVVSRKATLKSHQPSQEQGPGDPPRYCTTPWVQTVPRRGPDASGRCRIPPQRERSEPRSRCQP